MALQLPWSTVWADSTTERKIPASEWLLGAGNILQARAILNIAEPMSGIEVGLGLQVVNLPTDTPSNVGIVARQTATGLNFPDSYVDVSATTHGGQLARFVWLVARTTGTGVVLARASAKVQMEVRLDDQEYLRILRCDTAGGAQWPTDVG